MTLLLAKKSTRHYFSGMPLHPLLDFPRFSTDQVLAVSGLSAGELKGLLDRRQFNLAFGQNPGSGRARQFSGRDVLKLTVRRVMSPLGLPLSQVQRVADLVEDRAARRFEDIDSEHLWLAVFPAAADDWRIITIWNLSAARLPVAAHLLDVDKLINHVMDALQALIDGRPLPVLETPAETIDESPGSPENDLQARWARDDKGRQCLIGLTFDETTELREIRERIWASARSMTLERVKEFARQLQERPLAEVEPWSGAYPWKDEFDSERDLLREYELDAKHEAARKERLDMEGSE